MVCVFSWSRKDRCLCARGSRFECANSSASIGEEIRSSRVCARVWGCSCVYTRGTLLSVGSARKKAAPTAADKGIEAGRKTNWPPQLARERTTTAE